METGGPQEGEWRPLKKEGGRGGERREARTGGGRRTHSVCGCLSHLQPEGGWAYDSEGPGTVGVEVEEREEEQRVGGSLC
eukprot:821163-Rhodomonas_salina.3